MTKEQKRMPRILGITLRQALSHRSVFEQASAPESRVAHGPFTNTPASLCNQLFNVRQKAAVVRSSA